MLAGVADRPAPVLASVDVAVAGAAAEVAVAEGLLANVCKTTIKVVATILINSFKSTPLVLAAAEPMDGVAAAAGVVAVVFAKPAVAAVEDVAVTPVKGTPPVVVVVAKPVLGVVKAEIAGMPVLPVVRDERALLTLFAVNKSAAEPPFTSTPLILPDKAGGMTVGPLRIDNGCVMIHPVLRLETLKNAV